VSSAAIGEKITQGELIRLMLKDMFDAEIILKVLLSAKVDPKTKELDNNECCTLIRKIVALGSDSSDEDDNSIACIPEADLSVIPKPHGALTTTPDEAA